MTRRTSLAGPDKAHHHHDAHETESPEAIAQRRIHDELRAIPLLTPWTTYVAHEPSFTDELNRDLAKRVQELVFEQLEKIYVRLKTEQTDRDANGLLSPRASQTILENRLVVEAKRKIHLAELTHDMTTAMQTALSMVNAPGFIQRRVSSPMSSHSRHDSSVISQMLHEKEAEEAAMAAAVSAASVAKRQMGPRRLLRRTSSNCEKTYPPLFVEFPPSSQPLSELADQAEARVTTADLEQQVTNFRHRPVSESAVEDAGHPVSRRDVKPERVRYIMSSRLGALPPTKNILDEYPIPKEILEALERHRHYHVDESSLMASFDPVRAGKSSDWECYFRRSVPVERQPISFVLSSLEIADERPVPPPSDIFQQNLIENAINEDIMLTEVRQLYDHTHDAYREFRTSLHRHLDLPYLVDLSFRSSLNSTSYFLEDELVSSEPSVQIPERLLRRSNSVVSKWRVAKKNAMGRIAGRRGAIAFRVNVEISRVQRNELVQQICHFTPHEVQLMDLWYSHDAEAVEDAPYDPVPMAPALSARFDAVWMELQMPAKERLDLAVKYSSLENSSRLPDAVLLWEVTATLILEREELVRLARIALATPKKTMGMLAEETALLTDLAQTTTHLKEALLLTYVEVGDFVTLDGNFYLARMEHEASELRQSMIDSMENAKRKPNAEDSDNGHNEDAAPENTRDPRHRDSWK
ncbi:hypothetical protein Poli38472_008156 [Pythium oligandrum]|uniref:Uncharacterized protein n=1 Tax=Pythium oligandrum TaxID=41045 RepID=A0A8K1CL40_PYTOL|nr:hypothetical protein Poli38472_008156 [Pythium oligandrum]|eukprot:TMW65514.1 hypothetical protein Poli38472_008156 [Pythium oligandrum]